MKTNPETVSNRSPYVDQTLQLNTMQKRLYLILALLVPAGVSAQAAQSGAAQSGAAPAAQKSTLSLDEAINLARRNNPVHLAVVNNRRTADAAVRSANGQLLPNADASFQAQRQQGGRQIFGGTSLGASSDINQSQYSIGIGNRINRATLIAPESRSNTWLCSRRRTGLRCRTPCSSPRSRSSSSQRRALLLDPARSST